MLRLYSRVFSIYACAIKHIIKKLSFFNNIVYLNDMFLDIFLEGEPLYTKRLDFICKHWCITLLYIGVTLSKLLLV